MNGPCAQILRRIQTKYKHSYLSRSGFSFEIARGGVLPFLEFGQSSSINLYTAENSSWPYKFLILL